MVKARGWGLPTVPGKKRASGSEHLGDAGLRLSSLDGNTTKARQLGGLSCGLS
jgi:hypothetical protein